MFNKSIIAVAVLGAATFSANSATLEEVRVIATTAQNNAAHALIQNSTQDKNIAANKNQIDEVRVIATTAQNNAAHALIQNSTQDKIIAANKDQIAANYKEMKNNFAAVNSRIDDLDEEMKKGFASQAALAGLFQPYNVGKFNLSVALGGYESEQAMALGTGYRFNDNFAMKAGIATDVGGFDHLTYNIGANFEW